MALWKILMIALIVVISGAIGLMLDDVINKKAKFEDGVIITIFSGIILGLSILLVSL